MILAGLSILVLLLALEFAYRRFPLPAEYVRKAAHVGCGFLIWYWSGKVRTEDYFMLLAIFLIFFMVDRRLRILRSLHDIGRPSVGELTYLAGLYFLGAKYFGDPRFDVGLMLMVVPDAVAGAITYTRGVGRKDRLHAAIVFVSSLAIAAAGIPLGDAVGISLLLTVVEYFLPYGTDNLGIPLLFILVAG